MSRQLTLRPLALYDRVYGNASFVKATAKVGADLLLRLPSNRCVWGPPGPYQGRGAPPKHGHKFKLNAPESWPQADETVMVDDPQWGKVQVQRWYNYHFRQSPKRPMDIVRVEILQPKGRELLPLLVPQLNLPKVAEKLRGGPRGKNGLPSNVTPLSKNEHLRRKHPPRHPSLNKSTLLDGCSDAQILEKLSL